MWTSYFLNSGTLSFNWTDARRTISGRFRCSIGWHRL